MNLDFLKDIAVQENPDSFATKSADVLPVGKHKVSLIRYELLTDRDENLDRTSQTSSDNYPWIDATNQVAMVFAGQKGLITCRQSVDGYVKEEDLTAKQLANPEIEVKKGYVCKKTADGLVRIKSKERTNAALNMLNDYLLALGAEAGTPALEVLSNAVESKTELSITVYEDTYNGEPIKKVKNPRISFSTTTAATGSTDPEAVKEYEEIEEF